MKKILLFSVLFLAFAVSCKKSETSKATTNSLPSLTVLKTSFATILERQLDSSKILLQSNVIVKDLSKTQINTVSPNSDEYNKVVYIDFAPYHKYYNNLFGIGQSPKNNNASNLKINLVNPDPGIPVGVVGITGDSYPAHATDSFNILNAIATIPTPPQSVTQGISYQNQYIEITRNYMNLSSYTTRLNTLENTIYNDNNVSDDEKSSLIYQIEYLKTYAADLENNMDYYEGLASGTPVAVASIKNHININSSNPNIKLNKTRCHVDVGDVLMSGIVSGFWSGTAAAINGAAGGTIAIPGVGTVTGSVGGFVVGFTGGFVVSVVQSTISSLMRTCFK